MRKQQSHTKEKLKRNFGPQPLCRQKPDEEAYTREKIKPDEEAHTREEIRLTRWYNSQLTNYAPSTDKGLLGWNGFSLEKVQLVIEG